jgi:hypothetical protein
LAIRILILNAGKKLHRVIGIISNKAIYSCAARGAKVHVPPLAIEIQRETAILLPTSTGYSETNTLALLAMPARYVLPTFQWRGVSLRPFLQKKLMCLKSSLRHWQQLLNLFLTPLPTTVVCAILNYHQLYEKALNLLKAPTG